MIIVGQCNQELFNVYMIYLQCIMGPKDVKL